MSIFSKTVESQFYGTLTQLNFGGALMANAYKILLETCRTTLRARSRSTLLPVLHRASHFISIAADLAEHREPLLNDIADQLESTFGDAFSAHASTRALIMRDQELLLASLALCLLPGGADIAAGRFAIFGETLLQHQFAPQLMLASFELLETACMERLSSPALALLIPHWHRVRRYLEVCVELAPSEAAVIDEACRGVQVHFAADIETFENGSTKTAADLRTLWRTAALTAVPEGTAHLVRGLSAFTAHLAHVPMPQAMLDTSISSLLQAVDQRLSAPHRDWLMPVLEQCYAHVHVAVALGANLDRVVDETVEIVFAKHGQTAHAFPGARRKSAEDFTKVVRQSALAFLPGGGAPLAWGLWAFSESIFANRFGAEFFAHAYGELRQRLADQLAAATWDLLSPTLDQTITAVTLMADLAECADEVLTACAEALYQQYPGHLQQFRACREKTHRDMQFILRSTTIAIIPGGEAVLAHVLQKLTEAMFDRHFGSQFMWDAYEELARSVEAHLRHEAKHTLVASLQSTRDYIALMADLAEKEELILNETDFRQSLKKWTFVLNLMFKGLPTAWAEF